MTLTEHTQVEAIITAAERAIDSVLVDRPVIYSWDIVEFRALVAQWREGTGKDLLTVGRDEETQ